MNTSDTGKARTRSQLVHKRAAQCSHELPSRAMRLGARSGSQIPESQQTYATKTPQTSNKTHMHVVRSDKSQPSCIPWPIRRHTGEFFRRR
jgi:hypothetical protein